jgi:uncharacterized protein (TIGR00369 family)
MSIAPNAARFPPLPAERAAHWSGFLSNWNAEFFPAFVGLQLEEVRTDYARLRLPHRPQLNQPLGIVHGGALATLIDTTVVPAIGSAFDEPQALLTITMTIDYLSAVSGDAIAEGWVERRGKSTVFCRVEVRSANGELACTASLVYKVGRPRAAAPPQAAR